MPQQSPPSKPNIRPRRTIAVLLGQVDFDPEHVIEAAVMNSVLFVEAIEYRREAIERRALAKIAMERAQAETSLRIRQEAREAGVKTTEDSVASTVLLDPAVTEVQKKFAHAEATDEYLKLVVEAFRMRRDCLQIIKDLVRNEISLQSAVDAGAGKLAEARARLRTRFPGGTAE